MSIAALDTLDEAGILHQDISCGNLMVRKNQDGELQGLLVDFDVAVVEIDDDLVRLGREPLRHPCALVHGDGEEELAQQIMCVDF